MDERTEQQDRFLELLTPLRHRLLHFARAITNGEAEAEDLMADTVLAALEGFDRVENPEAFRSYLFTIAVRINRRQRRRLRLFRPFVTEHAEALPDRGPSPEISADIRLMYEALTQLPSRQRVAVSLFEISGLSIEEIRSIQGGSTSAVKMRLVRGRRKLAKLLGVTSEVNSSTGELPEKGYRKMPKDSFVLYPGQQNDG